MGSKTFSRDYLGTNYALVVLGGIRQIKIAFFLWIKQSLLENRGKNHQWPPLFREGSISRPTLLVDIHNLKRGKRRKIKIYLSYSTTQKLCNYFDISYSTRILLLGGIKVWPILVNWTSYILFDFNLSYFHLECRLHRRGQPVSYW